MEQKLNIENLIHIIRDKKVMLDFDLAMLYGVETKSLNQSVKRNIERFPEDFMFQLTRKEWNSLSTELKISQFDEYEDVTSLRSQIVTSNRTPQIIQAQSHRIQSTQGIKKVQLGQPLLYCFVLIGPNE